MLRMLLISTASRKHLANNKITHHLHSTMKNILIIFILCVSLGTHAQDFSKNLATAKTSYSGGNLENARFAMQQMMNEIDMKIGQEILKKLPAKMNTMTATTTTDNVSANTGLAGVVVHRDYAAGEKTCSIDIMGNSPLVATINAFLSMPFVGNSSDGTQKVVKISGYKGMLQKSVDSETNKTDYTLQIPLNASLLTFTIPNSTEAEVMQMANTIPMADIAKLVQ